MTPTDATWAARVRAQLRMARANAALRLATTPRARVRARVERGMAKAALRRAGV